MFEELSRRHSIVGIYLHHGRQKVCDDPSLGPRDFLNTSSEVLLDRFLVRFKIRDFWVSN